MSGALEDCVTLCDMPPPDAQAKVAVHAMGSFLEASSKLNTFYDGKGSKSFHMVPKHHMCYHMAQNFKFLDPKYAWAFQSEDFVGEVSKLAHSCSFGVAKSKRSMKVARKYRFMMHRALHKAVPDCPTTEPAWADDALTIDG